MKKPYVKPAVYAESFALMEHVAGGCIVPDNFAGAQHRNTDCGYDIGGIVLFTKQTTDCLEGAELFEYAGVEPGMDAAELLNLECYNSFYDPSNKLFAS